MNIGRKRPAFTLIELMIVIVIIAILAGLTTIGTRIAIQKTKVATVSLTMEQLSMAIEKYKTDIGEYPPDFTDLDAVARHIRKRWPRCEFPDVQTFLSEAAAQFYVPEDPEATPFGPTSALVFWLGGLLNENGKPQGFFLSPTNPLGGSGSSQREEPRFDFPDGTIVSGKCSFSRVGETKKFEGPAFQVGKDDSKPLVYFCASAPAENYLSDDMELENAAYQVPMDPDADDPKIVVKYCVFKRIGRAVPYSKNSNGYWTWHEPERFQLIHPGQDGLFSATDRDKTYGQGIISIKFDDKDDPDRLTEVSPLSPYPCTWFGTAEVPDNTLTKEDDDNIVSFAEGGTLESLYPEK